MFSNELFCNYCAEPEIRRTKTSVAFSIFDNKCLCSCIKGSEQIYKLNLGKVEGGRSRKCYSDGITANIYSWKNWSSLFSVLVSVVITQPARGHYRDVLLLCVVPLGNVVAVQLLWRKTELMCVWDSKGGGVAFKQEEQTLTLSYCIWLIWIWV